MVKKQSSGGIGSILRTGIFSPAGAVAAGDRGLLSARDAAAVSAAVAPGGRQPSFFLRPLSLHVPEQGSGEPDPVSALQRHLHPPLRAVNRHGSVSRKREIDCSTPIAASSISMNDPP